MHKLRAGLLALLLFGAAAGCTTNHSPGIIKAGSVALTFAVGTLNDSAGTITSTPGTYLNAVAAFRNQLGNSAFLQPGSATITPQGGGALSACSLFSYGQNPASLVAALTSPTHVGPYPNRLVFGMPPQYTPPNQNGIGYATGFLYFFNSSCSDFQAPPAPVATTYALSTTVTVNGGMQTYGASATLPSTTALMAELAPSYVSAGGGGGTFTVTKPFGVTETLIVVLSGTTEVATVETTGTTAVLAAGTLAPGPYTAFAIGADYPLVEAGPPANTAQNPALAGAGGTADLTVSAPAAFTQT